MVGKSKSLETNALVDLLIKQAESRGKLYIIVDGVNECSDPFELLEGLRRILGSTACIRILVSSINEKGIESSLKEMPNLIEKTLLPGDVENDISLLVQSTLESHRRLRQLSADLKEDIASALSSAAQGMYVLRHFPPAIFVIGTYSWTCLLMRSGFDGSSASLISYRGSGRLVPFEKHWHRCLQL